jgi:hypothetical protein
MKMKVFEGTIYEAVNAFNKWAKGKNITREVIIHTHVQFSDGEHLISDYAKIIVVHPDDPFWDRTEVEPIPTIQQETNKSPRMEREVIAQ